MGLLVNGIWQDKWYDTSKHKGEFIREASQIRNWITPDGSKGPSGEGGFKAESGRYHLYVSLACPWAHRTLIFRKLKELTDHISVSVVSPDMLEHGWSFDRTTGSTGDALYDRKFLHEIYIKNNTQYSGRVTVPILWDKKQECIVNNESAEIIRMFNSAFNEMTGNDDDFYPTEIAAAIDEMNHQIYHQINNGVYRCGFATTQEAYDAAFDSLFDTLDKLELLLGIQEFICGDMITEADWRLFTTLIRFDTVYYGHFKCNRQRIEDFPNLSNYLRNLFQWPGISSTVNFEHIKQHYYFSHDMINPTRIVPKGPKIDYFRPHNRRGH